MDFKTSIFAIIIDIGLILLLKNHFNNKFMFLRKKNILIVNKKSRLMVVEALDCAR